MIKLEHVVLASPEQMEFIIEGMRNPHNSWGKSDSGYAYDPLYDTNWTTGAEDLGLMQKLSNAGTDHRKYMRMMPVYVRITAPLYWWKEFDTYKVGTVSNSCSTMHKIHDKEFTLDDFSTEHLGIDDLDMLRHIIELLNCNRDGYLDTKNKEAYWWPMIQLLPSSYNQTRNVMMNYEVLANIYKSRKNHKLDEWRELCKWIETLPYSELIVGESKKVKHDYYDDYARKNHKEEVEVKDYPCPLSGAMVNGHGVKYFHKSLKHVECPYCGVRVNVSDAAYINIRLAGRWIKICSGDDFRKYCGRTFLLKGAGDKDYIHTEKMEEE